jgi:hypothetical protein
MDTQAEWVHRVLGVAVAGVGSGSGSDAPAEDGLDAATLGEWLDELNAQAAVLPAPVRADLLARVKQQRASVSADPHKAAAAIEALADDVAVAARAARVADAAKAAGDRVTYRRLQRQWQDAQDQARNELDAIVSSLLADPDLKQDARYPRLQSVAATVTSLIPDDGGLLGQELLELDEATDPAENRAARDRAIKALKDYSGKLAQQSDLQELQAVAEEEFGGVAFLGHLQQSLAALGAQLEKRA